MGNFSVFGLPTVEELKNASQTRNNRRNAGAVSGRNLTSSESSAAEHSGVAEDTPPPLNTALSQPGECSHHPGVDFELLCYHGWSIPAP